MYKLVKLSMLKTGKLFCQQPLEVYLGPPPTQRPKMRRKIKENLRKWGKGNVILPTWEYWDPDYGPDNIL